MSRWSWVLLLLPWSGAQAATLHKCVGKSGAVTYQSEPCPTGQRTERTVGYEPEPPPTAQSVAARQAKARRDRAESAYLSRLAGTSSARTRPGGGKARIEMPGSSAACTAAKAHRQSVLDNAGLRRTYDLLSKLDEHVRNACR